MKHFDAIVIGTGAVGSATVYQLARRGLNVLGIDRFDPPHDRGSSHGQTRMIRQAYFEHPNYVPLLLRAYELWAELESQSQRTLFAQVGLIEIGPVDGMVVPGVQRAAREHSLSVEELTRDEIESRFTGLRVPDGMQGIFEPTAGFLYVEDCIATHLELARESGAQLRSNVAAEWRIDGSGVRVEAGGEVFTADRCIITAGAWANQLLADVGLSLEVRRQPLFWYRCEDKRYEAEAGMPCFFYELPNKCFYGFPKIDSQGVKVALHSLGELASSPDDLDRSLHDSDKIEIEQFLVRYLPRVSSDCSDHRVCMYTMTTDEHFVVDRHPEHKQVVFAAGLSGHGFKFAGVLGEALADLAIDGQTPLPIDFLSLSRFDL